MYPNPQQFDDIHHTEIAITRLFKLKENSLTYQEENRIYLREFLDGPINNDDKVLALHELSRVYYCYPVSIYDPSLSHYELRSKVENDSNWTNLPIDQIIFQCQYTQITIGCPHRVSAAELYCYLCEKFYGCRFCHDEADLDHLIDVEKVQQVRCRKCNQIQKFSVQCTSCGQLFGLRSQLCIPCKRLDYVGPDVRPSVHCIACQRCYVSLPNQLVHCDACNICVKTQNYSNHNCSDMTCSVCLASIQSNFMSYITLNCGHYLHSVCRHQMLENGNYKCPICRKSILLEGENDAYVKQLTRINAFYAFSPEIQVTCEIQCDECGYKFEESGKVQFRCKKCNSFNTQIIERSETAIPVYTDLCNELVQVFFGIPSCSINVKLVMLTVSSMHITEMETISYNKFLEKCNSYSQYDSDIDFNSVE